jgi:site-specific DNA-adenine methylase
VDPRPLKAFRYSGSKTRLLSAIGPLPLTTQRIVEPYLGSGAFALNATGPAIGYEINLAVCEVWWWLQGATPADIRDLGAWTDARRALDSKIDVRELRLPIGPETWVRLNCASVVTGQLSSWRLYPQHRLPIEETIRCLARIREIEVIHGNGELAEINPGDGLFIDPPYAGTMANYLEGDRRRRAEHHDPARTTALISRTDAACILTYGTDARSAFPGYEWTVLRTSRVPNMRRGGTTDRTEHVAHIRHKADTPYRFA